MSLRNTPSFVAATPGSENLMVFVLADRLLVAVLTRDVADDLDRRAEQLREQTPEEVLAADRANTEIPLDAIAEVVSLPGAGPFEIELRRRSDKPYRFCFDNRNDRDTIFEELGRLLADRVPFFRQPPSRWVQMAWPLVLGIVLAALGVGGYLWFAEHQRSSAGQRLHPVIRWLGDTLHKEGVLTAGLAAAGVSLAVAVKRLLRPRARQRLVLARSVDPEVHEPG